MVCLETLCEQRPELAFILRVETDDRKTNHDKSATDLNQSIVSGISTEATFEEHQSMSNRSEVYQEALTYLEEGLDQQFDLDIFEDETEAVDQKLINTGYLIKRYQMAVDIIGSEISSLEGEIKMLQAKADIFKAQIARTKDRVQNTMQIYGRTQIDTPLVSIKMVENLPDVSVDPDADFSALEDSPYIETKRVIFKSKIIHDLKKGIKIPGFRLTHRPSTLIII